MQSKGVKIDIRIKKQRQEMNSGNTYNDRPGYAGTDGTGSRPYIGS